MDKMGKVCKTGDTGKIGKTGNISRIVFIHTVRGLTNLFDELVHMHIPRAKTYHILDDTLIHTVLDAGRPTSYVYRRLTEHAVAAEEFGADVIQLTCSSVSETVDLIKNAVSIPLLKVDEPMIRHAVMNFRRISVIATADATLNPTMNQLKSIASQTGKEVSSRAILCNGAYDAYLKGDLEEHDRIVTGYLLEATGSSDVIVLAQASIARVASQIEDKIDIPVLSSPEMAVKRLAEILEKQE